MQDSLYVSIFQIRDLCAISKPFASVVTDGILRVDAAWAKAVKSNDITVMTGGLISDPKTQI